MHKMRKRPTATARQGARPLTKAKRKRSRAPFRAPTPPDHNSIAVGMQTIFSIMEKWGLSPEEERTLLGLPSRSTYYGWKRGSVGAVVHGMDLATRISHMLGIFKGLGTIYEEPELADAWVKRPNDAFNGQSALDRMLAGQVTDLAEVRFYIDSVVS